MKILSNTRIFLGLFIIFIVIFVRWLDDRYVLISRYALRDLFIPTNHHTLMLGSSSIKKLNASDYFTCDNWLNRGIGSAQIADLRYYLNVSYTHSVPKHVLLYAGENDIAAGLSEHLVATEYSALIKQLIAKYPSVQVHIIAIKPAPARQQYWPEFQAINKQLADIATQNKNIFFYNNIWQDNKLPLKQYFVSDGIHLSTKGYLKFTQGINQLCTNT